MPIYEYRCSACGHELETLRKLSDAPLVECPACKAATLVKKVSAAGFQLKGSGWYVTDFRDKGKSSDAKKGAANATGDKPAGGANGDTATPAAKTESAPAAAKAESAPAASSTPSATPSTTPTTGSSSS